MKIKLFGAARGVTGSCFIIETGGARFAVDCGMHQGGADSEKRNSQVEIYAPEKIDFFIITHAHIDHSGLLPRMVKKGFRGPIYTTAPTRDLLEIMLMDSAHIQEMEAQWRSVRRQRHGEAPVEPLYNEKDAQDTLPLFKVLPYDTPLSPTQGISLVLRDAGHILGASMVELTVLEDGVATTIVFTGDIGRPAQLLVRDPSQIPFADYLFLESTYGERNHKNEDESLEELAEAIEYSYSRGEKVIIPAFAVARTQEMIYSLHLLDKAGRLPKDMPVYIDSPLAIRATEVFQRHLTYFDEQTQEILNEGGNPLRLQQLRFTLTREESAMSNNARGAAVVISASGMADAGRIKHHLRHNIWRPGASIVFVGFQARGTVGRKIVDGAKRVNILGEDLAVKARIFTINGFSGHAGQSQLLEWLGSFKTSRLQVFLTHGEYEGQQVLAELIRRKYGWTVHIPDYLEELTIKAGQMATEAPAAIPEEVIEWDQTLAELAEELLKLQSRKGALAAKPKAEQLFLQEQLQELKKRLHLTSAGLQ